MENMMMRSRPIWLIGSAIIILFSVLLRYLADEAHRSDLVVSKSIVACRS